MCGGLYQRLYEDVPPPYIFRYITRLCLCFCLCLCLCLCAPQSFRERQRERKTRSIRPGCRKPGGHGGHGGEGGMPAVFFPHLRLVFPSFLSSDSSGGGGCCCCFRLYMIGVADVCRGKSNESKWRWGDGEEGDGRRKWAKETGEGESNWTIAGGRRWYIRGQSSRRCSTN